MEVYYFYIILFIYLFILICIIKCKYLLDSESHNSVIYKSSESIFLYIHDVYVWYMYKILKEFN